VGLAYGGVNPPTNVVVAGQLGRRLGFFLSVKQSGVPLGGLLAGVALPPIAIALSWRWALGITVLATVAVAAATPLLRNAAVLRGSGPAARAAPIQRRELFAIGFFGFAMSGSQWTLFTYLTLFLTEDLGFTLGIAGLALALAQGVGAGGRLVWGWLSDSPGRRLGILLFVALLSAGLLAALAGGAGRTALWPLIALLGLALVGWNGAYHALVAERAGPGRIGKASGNALVFVFAGAVVLPPLLGLLADRFDSWRALWGVDAAIVVLAAVVLGTTRGSSVRAGYAPQAIEHQG
jgi:MFS family permease